MARLSPQHMETWSLVLEVKTIIKLIPTSRLHKIETVVVALLSTGLLAWFGFRIAEQKIELPIELVETSYVGGYAILGLLGVALIVQIMRFAIVAIENSKNFILLFSWILFWLFLIIVVWTFPAFRMAAIGVDALAGGMVLTGSNVLQALYANYEVHLMQCWYLLLAAGSGLSIPSSIIISNTLPTDSIRYLLLATLTIALIYLFRAESKKAASLVLLVNIIVLGFSEYVQQQALDVDFSFHITNAGLLLATLSFCLVYSLLRQFHREDVENMRPPSAGLLFVSLILLLPLFADLINKHELAVVIISAM